MTACVLEPVSPTFAYSTHLNSFACSSQASSAWAPSSSVFSANSSQSSLASTFSSSDCPEFAPPAKPHDVAFTNPWSQNAQQFDPVAPELRQNPRRTVTGPTTRSGCPPPLVRQEDRRYTFVDNLVDSSTQIVGAIWPLSTITPRNRQECKSVLPLRTFIQETLRRSKTSYSTLVIALYYLILIKPHVPKYDFTMEQPDDSCATRSFQCGRRMFLSALILASKYLQDRNYSARAWSKISGLNVLEINQNEMLFLLAIDWKLHVTNETYLKWTYIVRKFTPPMPPSPPSPGGMGRALMRNYEVRLQEWRIIILGLSPQLDNLAALVPSRSPVRAATFPPSSTSLVRPDAAGFGSDCKLSSVVTTPTLRTSSVVAAMEPCISSPYQNAPAAPPLRLPTPQFTPQPPRLNIPAASAQSSIRGSAMAMAVAQANASAISQLLTRVPSVVSSPPSRCVLRRRASIATSSTVSSPESMVSDSSRSSRSSSISSASSVLSAPPSLGVQARVRLARQCSERMSSRPVIVSAPEDLNEFALSSSPESYTGTLGKMCALDTDTPLGQREMELDAAARVLTELHYNQAAIPVPAARPGLKRSHAFSNDVQDDVRELLLTGACSGWPEGLVGPRIPITQGSGSTGRKRARVDVGCVQKVAGFVNFASWQPSSVGMPGPGMWKNVL